MPVAVNAHKQKHINWITTFFMAAFHAGAVLAWFHFTWPAFWVAVALWWVAGCLGIGMGYHRLLTHRSYKVPKLVEYFLSLCGTLALEGGPIFWVATHRIHHAHSDREGDPHSPRDGFLWAHIGWILVGESLHHDAETLKHYAPDLTCDRVQVWISKLHYLPQIVVGLSLLVWRGWPMVLWGIFLRVTLELHVTWLVNSATHLWGSRRFETRDDSTNNWWVALLTFGEGWHNNHHAHPYSARHGLAWYELDFNWLGIRLLKLLGLARGIQVAKIGGARAGEVDAA